MPESTPSGVAGLEDRYREARAELDPSTRRTLDRNLRLIDRARVEVRRGAGRALRVRRSGSVVRVSVSERWRQEADDEQVDLLLEVPRDVELRLQGVETGIRVSGIRGVVEVQTVEEDVAVRGPASAVRAQSVDGDVVVAGARGRVDLYTVDGDVRVTDVRGDVLFTGPVRDGGSYDLGTHDGDVWIGVARGTSAAFEVNVHSGSIDASFPMPGVEADDRGRVYRFTLGEGSSSVRLRSFDGVVLLRRPGELPDGRMPEEDGD